MKHQREHTHTVTIEVPLCLDEHAAALNYHPVQHSLELVFAVSRLAYDGVLCDKVQVRIDPVVKETDAVHLRT